MSDINYTINGSVLTVFDEDYVPVTIDSSHPNYSLVMEALSWDGPEFTHTLDDILDLMKPITKVTKAVAGTRITVLDDQVLFNNEPLHGTIVDRILAGNKVENLVKFLDKLMDNPSHRAVNQLYGFLEANNHAITSDGNFVAYKIVNSNYKDLYTGRFDNSPGTVVSVPRNQVDEDPDRTCSNGLHVCGFYYLNHYGSVRSGTDRVVSVVINPKDVVAVPKDYNNAKMRVSEYIVLEDITDKVKSSIGTTVGLDHALSYTEYSDAFSDDMWESEYGPTEYRMRGLTAPEDDDYSIEQDYYDGEWVDHYPTAPGRDGKGELPEWVDEDDWIEHDGSGFPYWDLDVDDMVVVKFRDGMESIALTAGWWAWDDNLGDSTIVAYRLAS